MQNYLLHDDFCIVGIPGENVCYGVMGDELHGKMMDILSGETLEKLEYLDEKDFRSMVSNKTTIITGNQELLKKIL